MLLKARHANTQIIDLKISQTGALDKVLNYIASNNFVNEFQISTVCDNSQL